MQGKGHRIERTAGLLVRTKIEILGSNCRLTFGPGARLWDCSITVSGDNCDLFIGQDCRLRSARLCVEDAGSRLTIGDHTTMTGATLLSQEGALLQIGQDCMIGKNADLRNSDSHSIYDGSRGPLLNPADDVILGDHIWVCVGAMIFKGSRIGDGAIIGSDSHVRGEIPARCMAAGNPATVRRQNIRWKRERWNATEAG